MPASSRAQHKVFVSYEHNDQRHADLIVKGLEKAGIDCWISHRNIPVARRYGEALLDAIEASRVFLLVFTRRANQSLMVDREVAFAASQGLDILPVKVEAIADAEISRNLRFLIGSHSWLDASERPLNASIRSIVSTAHDLLSQVKPRAHVSTNDARHHLVVFLTGTQATELWLTKNGLECYLYDFKAGEAQRQWRLSGKNLRAALDAGQITVKPESRYDDCGVFGVGKYTRWLYSKDIFPRASALRDALKLLVRAGATRGRR